MEKLGDKGLTGTKHSQLCIGTELTWTLRTLEVTLKKLTLTWNQRPSKNPLQCSQCFA